jgi:hypothetical protein
MGGGMSVRAELQRLRERVVQALADDSRNLVDPARGEVAALQDPEALQEYDQKWPAGIPGGIPSLYAWGYCRRTPGCPPWEALREHVQVDRAAALRLVDELRQLPVDGLLGRLGQLREMDHRVGRGWGWGAYRSPATQVLVAVLEGR